MKAMVLKAYGGVDQFSYEEIETPTAQEGEVLVRIGATSVNPIDWKMRSGAVKQIFPVSFPAVLGRDIAGEIAEVGPGVTGFEKGQRVMALGLGSYSEFAVVRASALAPIPDALDFQNAAALPLVTLTGAQLIERGVKPAAGESVLITGALGSVGRSAVYVATELGAQVAAGVRGAQLTEAELLGTRAVVAIDDEQALRVFKELDGVADTIGGAVAARLLRHIRPGGTYCTVVQLPQEAEGFNGRAERVTAQPDASRLSQLADAVARKSFEIPIAHVMKLSEAGKAHQLAESGGAGGKIVLVP